MNTIISKTNTIYHSFKVEVKNQKYTVLVAVGKSNYINVSKDMPNRMRGTLGREFKTFKESIMAYKSEEIKMALKAIENKFIHQSINN